MVKNAENMNIIIKGDIAYKILKNVRGSPAYFQTLFYDVLAIVRQLGIPTWFVTLSAADMQWPDLIQTIARQYGTFLNDNLDMSFEPVTAARQFNYRLQLLFKDVLKSNVHPLGDILDYIIRIEFQARGSPHAHILLWVKNAPKLGIQSDNEVCDFIDQHVTCSLSEDDPVLNNLVKQLQTHSHSTYCRKKVHAGFSILDLPA